MTGFYSYLESIMPVKRILISLAVGMVSFLIVLISGLTSDFVRGTTVASRTFSAFSFTSLACFIFLMSCEEYAIFKTKRELEHFVDDAQIAPTDEEFNRAEYLHEDDDSTESTATNDLPDESDATEEAVFRPIDFGGLSSQLGTRN